MHNEPLVTLNGDDGVARKPAQVSAIKQPLILQRPSALKQLGQHRPMLNIGYARHNNSIRSQKTQMTSQTRPRISQMF